MRVAGWKSLQNSVRPLDQRTGEDSDTWRAMVWLRGKLAIVLLLLQIAFIVVFAFLSDYDSTTDGAAKASAMYPMFQDVHVMIFAGIGFLLTFLKKYGFSGVSFNFLVGVFCIQWALIVDGLLHTDFSKSSKFTLGVENLMTADFTTATVLISYGAVLGKTSHLQLIVMALIEIVLSKATEYLGIQVFRVVDIGESIFIHVFGAYFGMAVARVLYTSDVDHSTKETTVYHSDLFSMIGTVFLWIFWPSFNGAAATGVAQQRAIVNTVLSLCACCISAVATSSVVEKKGKLDMVHVQNATLAGGVAVGATADLIIHPWGAVVLGLVSGVICALGYTYLTPKLHHKLKIHDTCGVNNLHGMPGILAAIASAVTAVLATEEEYGPSLYDLYPARGRNGTDAGTDEGRSAIAQGGYQILGLVVSIAIAVAGGLLTGCFLRLPIWNTPKDEGLFDDEAFWSVPQEVDSYVKEKDGVTIM